MGNAYWPGLAGLLPRICRFGRWSLNSRPSWRFKTSQRTSDLGGVISWCVDYYLVMSTICDWTWAFIVDLLSQNGDFPQLCIVMLNYQRVWGGWAILPLEAGYQWNRLSGGKTVSVIATARSGGAISAGRKWRHFGPLLKPENGFQDKKGGGSIWLCMYI